MPVLVVGYSVKAQGIGKDMEMEQWTLSGKNVGYLPSLTEALWARRHEVHCQLLQWQDDISCWENTGQIRSLYDLPF